jgi:HNH endonuclease
MCGVREEVVRTIPLRNGGVAIVDASDYEALAVHNWRRHPQGYAYRGKEVKGRNHFLLMHRVILGASPGTQVDHRDGDGLNNRRSNLRYCTYTQNAANGRAKRRSDGTSRYKGVSRAADSANARWRARVMVNGRNISLGRYDTEEAAARAYDAFVLVLYGDFARLNFADSSRSA